MVGTNKILTVSYGTFSCTLEGFDDSFGTMKAIAEYFRDLAADDRYFGAEPPTPDAEMLQRIAQREIRQRVEAYVGNEGVHLRADQQGALPAQAPAPQPAPAPQQAAPAPQPAPQPAPAPVQAAPEPAQGDDLGSVAAKLARIRAVVDTTRSAPAAQPTPVAEAAPVLEEQPAEEPVVAEEEIAAEPEVEIDVEDTPVEMTEEVSDEDEDDEIEEDAAELAEPEIEEIEEDEQEVALEQEIEEETPAEDELTVEAEAEDDLEEDEPVAEEMEEPIEAAAILDEIEDEDELDDSAFLNALSNSLAATGDDSDDDDDDFDDDMEFDGEDEIDAPAEEIAPAPQPVAAREVDEDDEDEDDYQPRAPRDANQLDEMRRRRRERLRAEARALREMDDDNDDRQEAAVRARARVLKVGQDDLDALRHELTSAPADEAYDDDFDAEEAEILEDIPPHLLSDTDEADLMAELDELEQDTRSAPKKPKGALARLRSVGLNSDDASVSRLVNEVNTKMDGAESRRRLSAIAHLKAAVAATMSDRAGKTQADRKAEDEAERSPYRDDLAKVVRPSARKPETASPKMPPLMLVSEQRIDTPRAGAKMAHASRGNLALRAIEDDEPGAGNIFSDDDSFADFADRHGARSLTQLLEAAAVYCVAIEGQPSFTRPQVMEIVAEAMPEEPSREDCLRAFGALLRDNKITKIKRGQFTVSKSSRYMPEGYDD
ncbi:hypothetical protein [Actibacterium sp. XHP0104]|uniref:hypothetical protein n=1 Tax=Actibacterium sp. XHP0104 TaxID=2984335 RepID=UPI0021E95C36|nr:hypothetical protein [Actibacterium sp. XHP0104]MCV2882587.1 hypothetical protein [Actibacterium sp. XHP0104]